MIRNINFYFTVAILVLLIYFLFLASLAPFNTACRVCHSDTYRSFKNSPHKNMRCASCHSGMTLSSKIDFRLLIAEMPFYFVFDSAEKARIGDNNCLYCHRTVLARTTKGNTGVRMSHKEPYQDGYSCSDCHIKDAHPTTNLTRGFPDMNICFKCHNGVKAKNECSHCHTKENYKVERNYYLTSYKMIHKDLSSHGKNPLKICSNCHDMSYCATCHVMVTRFKVALPHPDDWVGMHPLTTNRDNVRACYACHEKKFCFDCHGVEMPHPEMYVKVHIKEAEQETVKKCYKCHTKESCDFCHQNHRHPGVPQDLLKMLRRLAGFE